MVERIALIERFIALFGQAHIGLLLGDRQFIGTDWRTSLIARDIPFPIRLNGGQVRQAFRNRGNS